MDFHIVIAGLVFISTMLVIFWRPKGMNEAWPASIGAGIIIITGIVSRMDIMDIISKIGGASITIIATIVMAVILESFGFFHWAAARLASLSKGSGHRLYWYIQLLCFLMTLLFNNDGSILITTPILILLLRNLQLKPHQQIPYLLSGALTATASSAPIGVSNIVNLIALNIVEMSLWMHTAMMFVPATLGLLFMSWLMYIVVRKKLPKTLPDSIMDVEESFFSKSFHPLKTKISVEKKKQRTKFMLKVLLFVFVMRCLLFVASYINIPIEIVAVLGSVVLLIWRWYHLRTNPVDILKKTPWHILLFAFSMYVIIYGLHNVGLTELLVELCEPIVNQGLFQASFIMGGLVSVLSNLFNNHPALMIGTINKIKITWKDYLSVSLIVIPITTIVTLTLLYYWVQMVFA
jgi:arsenical pump membrane protein